MEEAHEFRKMKLVLAFALLGIALADPTVYFKEEFGGKHVSYCIFFIFNYFASCCG